jgi:predicted metal-dependent hydrolase
MEKHTIIVNGQDLQFELHRKKVKNINLNIKPDMTIMVSANENVPLEFIKGFVKDKVPWLTKKLSYFREAQPEKRNRKEYVNGESFRILGKQVRLKVEESEQEGVKHSTGFLYLYIRNKTAYNRKKLFIDNWLREEARNTFEKSLERIYPPLEKYGIKKPKMMIKLMKSRWGSSIVDRNTILLNFELIKAPEFCIDYVVLHELIHFKYRKHNEEFYNFLTALMPDWKTRKAILDEEVVREL